MKKKVLSLLLASAMVVSMTACGSDDPENKDSQSSTQPSSEDTGNSSSDSPSGDDAPAEDDSLDVVQFEGNYVFKDYVVLFTHNWNPHTYQAEEDSYLMDFIASGFYEFVFNDELHEVEGLDPFTGYKIIPLMAASEPVDVTATIKAEHPEFNIPDSAEAGYAYTIDLNPNAVWEDGTPINADSYVYSMQQLLDPVAMNYRATDYYKGNFVIAGAESYANGGKTVPKVNSSDAENMDYQMTDLVKGDDGTYSTPDGYPAYFGLNEGYAWMGGNALSDYYGAGYIDEEIWSVLSGSADEAGLCPVTDETVAALYQFTGSDAWGNEPEESLGYYVSYMYTYPEADYSTVGLYKSGDYQITLVLGQSLSGFNLLYSLTSNWLVKEDLYESCKKLDGTAYSSTYNTSLETTCSYGPYKLAEFQADKALRLVRNDSWIGYSDGQHIYKDPIDGKYYPMYQTTEIECQLVEEAETRKLMFLKGELMAYTLASEDFATYRNSDYAYATPGQALYFIILNGHLEAIQGREAASDFDQSKYDLETITIPAFRQAMALTYDRDLYCSTRSPANSPGFGIISDSYIYDPDTGETYRSTEQAKQVLCDIYSVDVSKYSGLDEAVASITGYDPVAARELYTQAFQDSLAAGYITDNDGDGICDQTIEITYCISVDNDSVTKTIDYMNEKLNEVITGTPFEGKIVIKKSAVYADWVDKTMGGLTDMVMAGWTGSKMNPFSLTRLYTNPDNQYDAKWFDATSVNLTLEVGGETITMNLAQWSDALNGSTVTVNGSEYNFGEAAADVQDRLTILAAIEGEILKTYNYIPMSMAGSMSLLSQQVYYVVEDYNPVLGRGGMQYMKYNYTEEEWADYIASQGGELKY